jgi:hypothetical protein
MPIDSRDKRASAPHLGLPWRGHYPTADGAVSALDREFAATYYAGIATSVTPNLDRLFIDLETGHLIYRISGP